MLQETIKDTITLAIIFPLFIHASDYEHNESAPPMSSPF